MKIKARLRAVVVGLLMVPSVPAAAQQSGSVAEGYSFARDTCAECHAIDDGFLVSPNPDATPFELVANDIAMTAMALQVWFRSPHPTMPNFILAKRDADNVIAYIRSLRN